MLAVNLREEYATNQIIANRHSVSNLPIPNELHIMNCTDIILTKINGKLTTTVMIGRVRRPKKTFSTLLPR